MSNQNGYIGRAPGDSAVIIASQTFEPSGIQTDFTFAAGYDPGYIDVYFNGSRLIYANDYTATNGTTVGLTSYATNGDVIEFVAYKAFNVGNVETAGGNFSVGNQLTVVGTTTATSAYYTGVVTASSFSGDGSALTGVASTDNIITSTASTFTGAVNITGAAGGNLLNVSGITTVGILSAYGSLTVSVWTLGASGTDHYTFTGPGDLSADTDPDLQLIRGQRYIFENRSGGHPFRIQSTVNGSTGTAYNDGVSNNDAGNGTDLVFDVPFDAPSVLYYQCTSHGAMGGVLYIGSSSGDDVNVGTAISMYASAGIVSATSFWGDGSNLEGVSSPTVIDITSSLFI